MSALWERSSPLKQARSWNRRSSPKEGNGAAAGWESHAEAGETARLFALIFLLLLMAYILVPWFVERRAHQQRPIALPKWTAAALAVLVLAGSAGTVITVVQAGHSGAKAVWCEVNVPANCEADGG